MDLLDNDAPTAPRTAPSSKGSGPVQEGLSLDALWQAYPLPTLAVNQKTGKVLFANRAFEDFFEGARENLSGILDRLIRDEAQRHQCALLVHQRMFTGKLYWCPAVLSPRPDVEMLGVVQVWRQAVGELSVRMIHFMVQPDSAALAPADFSPENPPAFPVGDALCYFSSAAHAAYNLWLLLDRLSSGIVLVDPQDRIFGVNQAVKTRYGYVASSCANVQVWWQTVHLDAEDDEVLGAALAEGKPFGPVRAKIRCADGSRRSVLVEYLPLPGGWRSLIYEDLVVSASDERDQSKLVQELEDKNEKIRDLHIALKVILEQRAADKKELAFNMRSNIYELVLPYLDKLDRLSPSEMQKKFLGIIRAHLGDIAAPFSRSLAEENDELTPRELQIANMLAQDMSTKDIAAALCLSVSSVGYYRNNLRRKLGIVDKKVNLKAKLRTLSPGTPKSGER